MTMISALGVTVRQYDHISKPNMESPCSTRLATYPSTPPNTIPRHSIASPNSRSLTKPAMFTTYLSRNDTVQRERAKSTDSLRRSVSGMKSLMPLQLSSSLPASAWSSPISLQRSTFGFEPSVEHSMLRISTRSSRQRLNIARPYTIRRECYRDTPVYTAPGSPLPNLVYNQEEQTICHTPRTGSREEISSVNQSSSSSHHDEDRDSDEETPLPEGLSPAKSSQKSRNSELSFKCLGELGGSLFRDESEWLSSPLYQHRTQNNFSLPHIMAERLPLKRDIEVWLDKSETCSKSKDVEGSHACATVSITPARAQVVDVNASSVSPPLPLRSSSLLQSHLHSPISDGGSEALQERRWRFERSVPDNGLPGSPLPKHSLNLKPPFSPKVKPSWRSRKPAGLGIVSRPNAYSVEQNLPKCSYSADQILSDLEEATSNSFKTLFPHTPCIASIRCELKRSSSRRLEFHPPPRSPFSEGVDWRPQPIRLVPPSRVSVQRTISSRTSRTFPLSRQDWNEPTRRIPKPATLFQHQSNITPAEPNLRPLAAVFPNTPPERCSTLYAHILAYLYLSLLSDYNHILQIPTPPPTPPYLPSLSTTSPQSISPRGFDPFRTSVAASRPRHVDVTHNTTIPRPPTMEDDVSTLLHNVRFSIESLTFDMGGGASLDEGFLRALCEIVKGCERECFGICRD